MDPNNHFNTQNSANFPFNQNPNNFQNPNNYQNPNYYQNPNQFSNQHPQNIPSFGFPPNFNQSSSVPNFQPYYGSMPRNPSQTPPFNGYVTMANANFPSGGVPEFPEFSTQLTIGGMIVSNEVAPNSEDSTPKSRKTQQPAWNTEQNLVLISGWIKFGTSSVVGRNQKGETYWGKTAEYCNEHCSFDPPRDGPACRNRFNYMNKVLGKWIGAYDGAKRMQGSGWSENDVLAKAQELYACGKNVRFTLMEEWHALRDQPHYVSQVGVNIGSGSSGSKRSREIASHDLWIWHGKVPSVNFFVNQRPYNMAYYLADGIYPSYPTFVKSIRLPQSEPDKLFAKFQEGYRKDIERAFGMLQARFKIIREPARLWDIADLGIIMRSCIILHNMIVEDERDSYSQRWTDFEQSGESGSTAPQPYSTEVLPAFANHVRARSEFRDPNVHQELQADLVKHIWTKFGMFRD
ncbi:uncharacterized protein LOC131653155 [Vicia villosa]|uniref:uncharacterized protein LOC131653155 n=1 Tax=Vicia villosa TaxID=3911 RepID=UPI00273BC400|nr:uncharacterized protein LOC131653155 [Vicia villosa]